MPTVIEKAPAIALSTDVLMEYKPDVRELGTFTKSRFMIPVADEQGEITALAIRPGVWRKPRAEWQQWASSTSPDVRNAIACNALRVVSEETDISKIDAFLAQDIIRNTQDIELLKEWSKGYATLPDMVKVALEHKQESMVENVRESAKFVFGNQVA